jgi:hypothetical protein
MLWKRTITRSFGQPVRLDPVPTGEADAAPQSVTITVSFQEIFPLDKSTIDADESGTLDMTPKSGRVFREQDSTTSQINADAEREAQRLAKEANEKQAQVTKNDTRVNNLQVQYDRQKQTTADSVGRAQDASRAAETKLFGQLQSAKADLQQARADQTAPGGP